jgi:hypothetical protein
MVLEHQLPVAVVGVLEDAAGDLELAAGRAIDEIVERGLRRPEELLEVWYASCERGEDEAAVHGDTRHRLQTLNISFHILFERYDLEQRRCGRSSSRDRRSEALGVAPAFGADHRAPVRAAVHQNANFFFSFRTTMTGQTHPSVKQSPGFDLALAEQQQARPTRSISSSKISGSAYTERYRSGCTSIADGLGRTRPWTIW